MLEKTTQAQAQAQAEEHEIAEKIAEKILRGETLTEAEAILLTKTDFVKRFYYYLQQMMFWGI